MNKNLDTLVELSKTVTAPLNEIRSAISNIEEQALANENQIDIPIQHHFSNGVYAREMQMPKGALVVGKIHKKENLNILSKGEVSVFSQDGVIRVKAPYTFVGTTGAKRVIYAHEDVVWTTIHGTHETDLEKIENEFIAKNYNELPEGDLCHGLQLASQPPEQSQEEQKTNKLKHKNSLTDS